MKTLKIAFLLALFVTVSSQTNQTPAESQVQIKEVNSKKIDKTEMDLLAHMVRGLRVPTQG